MNSLQHKDIIEAALLVAGEPLSIDRLCALFPEEERPDRNEVRAMLEALQQEWAGRPMDLKQVGSGYRLQVRQQFAPWLSRLSEERAPRYSRALLETLALIVYRQPITRGSIEEIRGVTVSTSIIKTLTDRDWIRIVGYRDVPGKPALYGTTKRFLDDFNLASLTELPPLSEIRPIDHLQEELDMTLSPDAAALEGNTHIEDDTGVPTEAEKALEERTADSPASAAVEA